ncbi:hypothetical protein [Nocardia sp. CC227C]|uniref:hypothetical protein n=1 Tax=Nocardia sp. CC227C TaxID=3044562 RepID=UPI00278BDDD0|nr:hypothetical protein [Nocardia sp. CC227C]
MNEKVEHFLLYELTDDWMPIGAFDAIISTVSPEAYSRMRVLEAIRELAEREFIRFGAFPGGGRTWEPWDVSLDEAIDRIAYGYNNVPGYLAVPYCEISSNEVFRADLLEKGERRLVELGNPYDRYGDPWKNV